VSTHRAQALAARCRPRSFVLFRDVPNLRAGFLVRLLLFQQHVGKHTLNLLLVQLQRVMLVQLPHQVLHLRNQLRLNFGTAEVLAIFDPSWL
jgi:hypothetical protein